jgi:hypothetical protein
MNKVAIKNMVILTFSILVFFPNFSFSQKRGFEPEVGRPIGIGVLKQQNYYLNQNIHDSIDLNGDRIPDFILHNSINRSKTKVAFSIIPLNNNGVSFSLTKGLFKKRMVGLINRGIKVKEIHNWTSKPCYFLIKTKKKVVFCQQSDVTGYFVVDIIDEINICHGWVFFSINTNKITFLDASCIPSSKVKIQKLIQSI